MFSDNEGKHPVVQCTVPVLYNTRKFSCTSQMHVQYVQCRKMFLLTKILLWPFKTLSKAFPLSTWEFLIRRAVNFTKVAKRLTIE
jgi:hypothetical protein